MVRGKLGLVDPLVLRDDLLGTAWIVEVIRDQGEAEQAGLEREGDIVLDRCASRRYSRFRDDGFAAGIMSRRRVG